MNSFRRLVGALAACIAVASALAPAHAAADYPNKPVRLVVPYPAGGVSDILGRTYAEKLRDALGQPIVVDNKPGATGAIGTDAVAKAPGDGYTLLLNSSSLTINPWIVKQPFDFMKDLTPVARTGDTPYIVVVDAKLPIRNLDEFIAYAKKNPGKLSCGTYGIGSPPHIALELFKQAAGVDILHVPYKTSMLAVPDLLSGQLSCVFEPPPGSQAHIEAGTLRRIAHTGSKPMSAYPGADAIGKRYPGATVVGWQAIFAPSSTPKPVLDRLRADWAKTLANPAVVQKLRESGFEPSHGSIEDFKKEIASDYEKFGKVIKATGIRLE
ncbi:MAG: tripartite tricarboxylate transporter substrate binding protein [Gammaproteobacteria bacterium]|nr:tripartite tricarboxylate transporter substrate binding protein [Gammaproteobacteria bacterium]MBU1444153.1 tripartite tricarboxylate transporter substrate binding protein [Gammaproteobacteria bacterium]MBU2288894.1 tripartite tricarboxylate transporter substrate binding protein [Gammaproteobacteria bacterium]